MATVGAFFLYETLLPPAVRTLVWLVTAREFDCDYAWHDSVRHARAAGVATTMIDALARGDAITGAPSELALTIAFCQELLRGNHHVCDATYQATVKQFGVPATVQIAASLGYIAMMACVANAFDIAPQADDSRPAL